MMQLPEKCKDKALLLEAGKYKSGYLTIIN
jgi:hypothetical protein